MGVPEMPASHAEHRTARDPGRGTLAPDLFWGSNGDARDIRYRQAEIAGIAVVERLERTVGIASAVRWLRNAHVAEQFGVEKPTQKLQSFFSRWSIKLLAEYSE